MSVEHLKDKALQFIPSSIRDDTLTTASQNWQLLPVTKYLIPRVMRILCLGANWLLAKVLRKPILDDQLTLLYELDTLQLMYSTNDKICVGFVIPNCHLPHYFGETGTTTPRNRWLSIRFVPLTLSLLFFVFVLFCFVLVFFFRFLKFFSQWFFFKPIVSGG